MSPTIKSKFAVLLAQLSLLLWKNLVVLSRSKLCLILELIFFLLLLPYTITIVKYSKGNNTDDAYSFEPLTVTGNFMDIDRIVSSTQTIDKYYNCNLSDGIELGYSYEPGLRELAVDIMDLLEKRYNENETLQIRVSNFSRFEAMLEVLKQDLNKTKGNMCGKYLGGIHFQSIRLGTSRSSKPQLVYKILLPQSQNVFNVTEWDLETFWLGNDPNQAQIDHNQIPREPPYWQSGFLSIQFAIDNIFLEMNNESTIVPMDKAEFSFLRVPIDKTKYSPIIMFLKAMWGLWLVSILGIMLHTAKEIVIEKEAGIKSYMTTMGLHPMAFYLSHTSIGVLKAILVVTLCTGIISTVVEFTSATLLITIAVLFAISLVCLSALISTFAKTMQMIQMLCLLIPLIFSFLTFFKTPPITKIGLCFLSSLNPIAAFSLAISHVTNAEINMLYIGWMSIFRGASSQFSIGYSILMLIFDILLFCLLTNYVDSVFPTDDSPRRSPFFFLEFFRSNKSRSRLNRMPMDQTDAKILIENMEPEHGSIDEADIIVQNMSKRWGHWGNFAVVNLNFKAYRGQISVLLGHNGAGKTTTFSVITGTISSSDGQVLICGKNLEENLSDCQKRIGYCPQHNPLFEKLTVKEHLQLFAGLKTGTYNGPEGKQMLQSEIDATLKSLSFAPQINIQAQNLSGGQKRKLCVAISLIAGSQVVLLDEPTAGMDPIARSEMATLLGEVKKERTVLLTTHYMEEADKLGDRIGIMVNGRLMCNGSPEFLKNKFGTGYILSIVSNLSTSSTRGSAQPSRFFYEIIGRILDVIRKHSPNARVDRSNRAPEFTVVLPISDKQHFANLFEELEAQKEELCIDSFGLSLNTLEQVFLKVGELAEPAEEHRNGVSSDFVDGVPQETPAQKLAAKLFGVRQQQFVHTQFSKFLLCLQQIIVMIFRQFLWTIRNPLRSLTPMAIAISAFILVGNLLNSQSNTTVLSSHRSLSLDEAYEKMQIPVQIKDQKLRQMIEVISKGVCSNCLLFIDPQKDIHTELKKLLFKTPPMVAGVAVYENKSTGNLQFEAIFNGLAIHSPAMSLSFLSNALLGANSLAIRPTIEIYDVPSNGTGTLFVAEVFMNFIVAVIVIFCYAIFTATMIVPLVEERGNKFKHQLMLTKLHVFTYWVSVFIWNAFFFVLYSSVLLVFFIYVGWMQGFLKDLCLLLAAFFWCYVPLNAALSFIFSKPQRAFTAVLSWGSVASIFFLLVSQTIKYIVKKEWLSDTLDMSFYLINPVFVFASGVMKILKASLMGILAQGMTDQRVEVYLRKEMLILLTSGLLFWVLVGVIQSRVIVTKLHRVFSPLFNTGLNLPEMNDDVDVEKEREKLSLKKNTDFVLAVHDLTKFYGRFPALRQLTFGVRGNECFGLLGVNGAGKTTTFDILTGVRFATSGNAFVEGVNVNAGPAIGYCPQFDALAPELTGKEVLLLVARLNGLSDVGARVSQILQCILMEEHANKMIKKYSGGQRRRISLGLTLLTSSSLIMLDEPTAGIDPRTRRQIWNLLQAIRQHGIAILLTSHSMEECEELCSKIAFLNKGMMIGVGTNQHLKSRFGSSFLLTFTIANPSELVSKRLNKIVVDTFKVKDTDEPPTSSVLRWEIPKNTTVLWSELFRQAQALADKYPSIDLPPDSDLPKIIDFSLTQNSLEQIFLRLSGNEIGNI